MENKIDSTNIGIGTELSSAGSNNSSIVGWTSEIGVLSGDATGNIIDNVNVESIKAYLSEMANSDRRGTADMFYYVIRTSREEMAPLENCDKTKFYWRESTYDSVEEMAMALEEEGYELEDIEEAKEEAQEYGVRNVWDEKGMFLTEKEAQKHLELNHYHYSSDAHTYVHHAWRAPEMLEFFKNLFEHFGIEKKWG